MTRSLISVTPYSEFLAGKLFVLPKEFEYELDADNAVVRLYRN